jgi:hypothetical protein
MPKITKKRIAELTKQATRYGYSSNTSGCKPVWVKCPLCNEEVRAEMWWFGLGPLATDLQKIKAAMSDHLTNHCGED